MKTCSYCNQEKDESKLVPLGNHFEITDYSGNVRFRWICAPDTGCQKSNEATWGAYFQGALFYDLPFFVFGALLISALHYILFPVIESTLLVDAWKWEAVFCGIFAATPVLFSLFLRLPIFISPVLLTLFSIFVIL